MIPIIFGRGNRRPATRPTRPRRRMTSRPNRLPELEPLESRTMLTGSWTSLAHGAPGGTGTMMLLSDGTVMAQGGGTTNTWYRLSPDSSGSYVNGTWTQPASMSVSRLYFASNVLTDGRVFVVGGEYSSLGGFTNTGEVYNPVTNAWSNIPNYPLGGFGDDPSSVLPDGRVLTGYVSGPKTEIYDPVANTWSAAGTKLDNDRSDEETWVKLPDGSILSYDVFDNGHAQRYIPSQNQWVETGTVPVALSSGSVGSELGPAFLLPDGRAFFIGANGNTAFYTPSTDTWAAGPVVPNGLGADDAPGAMLPNGKILFAADKPLFNGPTSIFEFDPTANTYTNVTPAGNIISSSGPSFVDRMLVLPTGQVLLTDGGNALAVYTPDGSPVAAGVPTISGIQENADGSFLLTGTGLNGISEGASYGDDAEMASNYPIVSLADSNGNVFLARAYNWSSTGVATGSATVTTDFTLPIGLPAGTYSVSVAANGIASAPVSLTTPTSGDPAPTVASAASASPGTVTGRTTNLSVLGADQAGESALTYTWSTTSAPSGAGLPSFSANGTNAAKNDVATFHKAGNYTFTVTMTNLAGLSTTSSVGVVVNQTLSSITVSPTPVGLNAGQTKQFSGTGFDQFGNTMTQQPTFTWAVTSGGGTVSGSGLYTAPGSGTLATVTGSAGGFSKQASVYVVSPPWSSQDVGSVGTSGAASDNGNGVYTVLGAGNDVTGTADSFRYDYQTLSGDGVIVARVATEQNTNASAQAGVLIRNDLTAGSAEAFMAITPTSGATFVSRTSAGGTATTVTKTGIAAPSYVKLVRSGSIFTGYTSPDGVTWTQQGSATIAMGSTVDVGLAVSSNNASVLNTSTFDHVTIDATPTVASAASASPNPVSGTTTNLSVLGSDKAGESSLTYTWATTSQPAGAPAPTFSANGTNAAKNDVATFGQAGSYTFTATIANGFGFSTTSSVNVVVNQTLTAIAVSPTSATVADGATQSFAASASDQFGAPMTSQPSFTWTVDAGGAGGTVSPSGTYTAPASGSGSDTVRAASGSVSGAASVNVTAGSASAQLVGTDATTQGNWRSAYGQDGYEIEGDQSANNPALPAYAQLSFAGASGYTWGTNTGSPYALQAASGTGDIASTWYSTTSFDMRLNLTDGQSHEVSLYALDWDQLQGWNVPRSERIDVLDAGTGAVLATQTVSSFLGEYVSFNIKGDVDIRATNLVAGNNAVIGGLFLGGPSSSASAQLIGADATTQGNWRSAYGKDGYDLQGDDSPGNPSLPSYATVSLSGAYTYTWGTDTGSPYALRNAAQDGDVASTWFSSTAFDIHLGLTDGQAHKVTLYALDWDQLQGWNGPRSERIDVLDAATGAVLATQTLSSFVGEYVSFSIAGAVDIRVTNLVAGNNAVVGGIFFGGPTSTATASVVGTDATTQGGWRSAYGGDGYDIAGDSTAPNPSLPSYATVGLSGAYTYTWGTDTGSPYALRNAAQSGDVASTWFSSTSFDIDLNLTDGQSHLVSLYALDWDRLQGWNGPRSERIDVLDAGTGAVLATQTIASFAGEYVSFTIRGSVDIRVTNLVAGNNAVIGGLFFGTAAGG